MGLVVVLAEGLIACRHGSTAQVYSARQPGRRAGRAVPRLAAARVGDYRCPPREAPLGVVVWRAGRAHLRRYWAETDLQKVVTSKERPVEVCGVAGQIRWLLAATCPGGSHPFSGPIEAHRARLGNVGPGGRCGTTIVDLYRVRCPSRTFLVYMDLYECEEGHGPFDRPATGGGP